MALDTEKVQLPGGKNSPTQVPSPEDLNNLIMALISDGGLLPMSPPPPHAATMTMRIRRRCPKSAQRKSMKS